MVIEAVSLESKNTTARAHLGRFRSSHSSLTQILETKTEVCNILLHILDLNPAEQPVHCVLERRSIKRGKLAFRDSSSTRSASWAMNLTKDKLKGD